MVSLKSAGSMRAASSRMSTLPMRRGLGAWIQKIGEGVLTWKRRVMYQLRSIWVGNRGATVRAYTSLAADGLLQMTPHVSSRFLSAIVQPCAVRFKTTF